MAGSSDRLDVYCRSSMFRLVVEGASPAADAGSAEVVIRDRDGAACAYGWHTSGDYWLRFPAVGTFRLRLEDREVAVVEGDGLSQSVLDAYYSAVLPLAYHLVGFEALHASAVLTSGGVVALCASSETGKSTLAYGLSRRGNLLWTDDVLVFEIGSGQGVACHPVPFTLHLRPQTQAHYRVRPEETTRLRSAEDNSRLAPFAALLLIEREERSDQPPLESERLPLSKALPAVLPHAFRFTLNDPERKRRMMQSYLDLVARVPVVRVGFVPGFEQLPRVLDGLEEAIRDAVRLAA